MSARRTTGQRDARARGRSPSVGRAARSGRCVLSRPARLSVRPLSLLSREAECRGIRLPRGGGRAGRHRRAASDGEGRDPRNVHARESDRRASLCRSGRDRPDLLDERHHRHAELHPAHNDRPRQLGDGVGAQLRELRCRCGSARGVLLQRGTVRGRRCDRGLRSHRPVPHPARHREHGAPDVRGRAAAAGSGDPHSPPTPRI
jgi:hypothetical protein